ncbi:hypothetical protein [Klebsiella pneumoniae]|uniref:hypothetical protein n=1 Tax=Klebsiella pneumoniae TaxID=573 RepID=UPI00216429DD|nr:hypothetical protein [Klebsiella pneumoniae]
MTMWQKSAAICVAVITKPTLRKVTNAKRKRNSTTKLNVISAVSKAQTQAALTTAARITPMTDITELAQREKFEAWVMTQICISKSTMEGLRTADGYRNTTLSGTNYNRMWNCWKAADAELVEALEKAQKRISQLESRTVKLPEPEQWDITQGLLCKKKVVAAIRAAGIKVEVE